MTDKPLRTTAVFAAACVGMCFFGVSMITLGSVLPELAARFSLSAAEVTALTTSLPFGILIGSLAFGPVVDRYGHKVLLLLSCLAVLAGVATLAWAPGVAWLAPAIAVIGLGGGILNGETNALVTEIYDERRRASRLSLLGMFYGAGALVIPVLLERLGASFSYNTILAGVAALMAVGVVYCATVRFPAAKQPQGFPLGELRRIIGDPALLILSLVLFFQSGTESVTNNWTTTFTAGAGFTEAAGLGALTAMLVGLTAARLIQVWLLSRVAPMTVLWGSLGVALLAFEGLGVVSSQWGLYICMALVGAGLASTFPVIFGILGTRFQALSGTAFSIALTVALCGQMVMNPAAGLLSTSAEGTGISSLPHMLAGAVAAMGALLLGWRAISSRKSLQKQINPNL